MRGLSSISTGGNILLLFSRSNASDPNNDIIANFRSSEKPQMHAHKYVEENSPVGMLASKKSGGVAPEMNFRERVTCTPLPSAKSKTTLSVVPQIRTYVFQFFFLKKLSDEKLSETIAC